MKISTQIKVLNTKNYYNYLKDNSMFFKELNRGEYNFALFDKYVKKKYSLMLSDRINKALESVGNIYDFVNLIK